MLSCYQKVFKMWWLTHSVMPGRQLLVGPWLRMSHPYLEIPRSSFSFTMLNLGSVSCSSFCFSSIFSSSFWRSFSRRFWRSNNMTFYRSCGTSEGTRGRGLEKHLINSMWTVERLLNTAVYIKRGNNERDMRKKWRKLSSSCIFCFSIILIHCELLNFLCLYFRFVS